MTHLTHTRRGFTLVELLVVIGIIALLISILLPSLNKARESAKSVQCLSNLRQIGITMQMYVLENKGVLPFGYWSGGPTFDTFTAKETEWTNLLITLYGVDGATYQDNADNGGFEAISREVFKCPSAESGTAPTQYSAHPRLMPYLDLPDPDPSASSGMKPYKIARISDSSSTLLVADASLRPMVGGGLTWGAQSTLRRLDWLLPDGFRGYESDPYMLEPLARNIPDFFDRNVSAGPNVDGVDNAGNLRFRHGSQESNNMGGRANILFVDGHADGQAASRSLDGFDGELDTGMSRRMILVPR